MTTSTTSTTSTAVTLTQASRKKAKDIYSRAFKSELGSDFDVSFDCQDPEITEDEKQFMKDYLRSFVQSELIQFVNESAPRKPLF